MKRKQFDEFLEFLGYSEDELCDILGYGNDLCPNMEIEHCEDLLCMSSGNPHCWKKYFEVNLKD